MSNFPLFPDPGTLLGFLVIVFLIGLVVGAIISKL